MAEQNNQAERAAFEAWHRSKFATRHSTGQPTRDMHNGIYDENYGPEHQQQMWEAWQAASRAALPAAVDAEGLPPLPEMMGGADLGYVMKTPDDWDEDYRATWQKLQVADCNRRQWRAYAMELRSFIAADRRKQAALTQMIELGQDIEASGERSTTAKNAAVRLPDVVSVMLWLYRRLPRCYGRPPHVEVPIAALAKTSGVSLKDVEESFAERGATPFHQSNEK